MSITLNWNPFRDTAVDSFQVYRSITGFVIPYPNDLMPGAQLKLQVTSDLVQTVTFTSTTFSSLAAQINSQVKGLVAVETRSGIPSILVRAKATQDPVIRLLSSSALAQLQLTPGIAGPKQNFLLIGTVPFVSVDQPYTFVDLDGDPSDYYYLTAMKNLVPSLRTVIVQPTLPVPRVCVIEGRIVDLNGSPVVGALINVQIEVPDHRRSNSGVVTTPRTLLSDSTGRWSLALPQGTLLNLQIPAISYNQVVIVPRRSAVLFRELRPVNDQAWDPSGFTAGTPFVIDDGLLDSPYGEY